MKRNKIFALMVAAMTFAACSTNDITSDTRYDDDNTLKIGTVTRSGEAGTTTESVTPMSDPFLLTNVTQKMNVGDLYEAMFTLTEESSNKIWSPSSKIMWYGSGVNEFQAIYPCKTKNGSVLGDIDFNKFMIPGFQDGRNDSIPDWMRATANVARNNGALNLNFEHMLSKVTVVIDYNNITLDGNTVTRASVSKIFTRVQYCEAVTGEDGNVTINPYQNTYYNTDGLYIWTTSQSDDTNKAYTTAIVAPGAYSNIAKAVIYCDNDDKEIVLSLPNGITLEAGKHYTFTLSSAAITSDQATISSVSVEPWDEGTITGTKPAEKIIPYVTFTSNEEVGFMMRTDDYTISGLEYSVNNGEWKTIPSNGMSEGVSFGGSKGNLRLRGKNLYGTSDGIIYSTISFSSNDTNAEVACTGDIRTLLDYENYNTVDTRYARFSHLFYYCTQLTSAPELPATTLANSCYAGMFMGCTSLTTAPELPATTLADGCYLSMFVRCTSLTKAPELPATTLTDICYADMFSGCTSLTRAPELKATTLADRCYISMFDGCKSLTTAPELPATTLANSCYADMFSDCTSLTTAPELKATTLAEKCYYRMFEGCTSLTQAPELKATTLAINCYSNMFNGCTNLKSVTMLATNVSANDCLYKWLKNAGTSATSRTLKVNGKEEYDKIKATISSWENISNLPDIWQAGANNTKILDKDGYDITSTITLSSSN
ncbi:hypothetical protein CIK99_09470 [Prevotella sp. P5-92]|uniref:fimbrillin family protein n=1 Tax=Prevotella sp. P5-92 TaxID=2024222 RepID=UPI000B95CEFF|nr:fimbrillin family protein [Prevotella sp. P5-92]OYP56488.1 hypothetical protein CIK99_09470 [Prevotella sp. P5-92]